MQTITHPTQIMSPSMPVMATQPLIATGMGSVAGSPVTQSVVVPSTQSLIPPPSTILASSYGLPPQMQQTFTAAPAAPAAPISGYSTFGESPSRAGNRRYDGFQRGNYLNNADRAYRRRTHNENEQ